MVDQSKKDKALLQNTDSPAEEVITNDGRKGIDPDFERFATEILFAVITTQLPYECIPGLIIEMNKHGYI